MIFPMGDHKFTFSYVYFNISLRHLSVEDKSCEASEAQKTGLDY